VGREQSDTLNHKGIEMADASRIYQLLLNRRDGVLSPSQEKELDAWASESPDNKEFLDRGISPATVDWHLETLVGTRVDETLQQLLKSLEQEGPPQFSIEDASDLAVVDEPLVIFDDEVIARKPRVRKVLSILAAAAVLLSFAVAVWLFQRYERKESAGGHIARVERPLLKFGTDSLYLDTLRDGAVLSPQRDLQIRKMDERHIKYWYRSDTNRKEPLRFPMTSTFIVVPHGKDSAGWQVSLPDGSRAVLYSGVMSVFPISNDPVVKRGVSLAGNAFFDIVGDSVHPFVIETSLATMQVRGTLFSIEADSSVRTDSMDVALYTGNMNITSGGRTRSIHKGDLAMVCRRCAGVQLARVTNMKYYLPWKNPVFDFSHQPVYKVMDRVKKWFMYDVKYSRKVDTSATEKFNGGAVSKDQSLYSLLDAIEPRDMTFRVEDKTRTIFVDTK
jgi:ferric-dicitrate binding protein FerR (iron transport regulator)